ncbi:SDR family NAD(P)-dependent oxidoreductase [Kribbella antibiotica]|nr:SDR family NAD(P)-dependent oxidoreductase [Kribbella antibiotica]
MVFGAGSSGAGLSNGQAAALTYARAGAAVACVDRDPAAADRITKEINAAGGTALAVQADATREDDVARAVAEVVAAWQPPGGLHNNVGVPISGAVVETQHSS